MNFHESFTQYNQQIQQFVEQFAAALTAVGNPRHGRALKTLLPGLTTEQRQSVHILLTIHNERFSRLSTGAYRLKNKAASTSTVPAPQVKPKVNHVTFVYDRSGSMQCLTKVTVELLNNNIQALREQAAKTGQRTTMEVISFDTMVETVRPRQDVSTVKEIRSDEPTVVARGGTNLFDAVGKAIENGQLDAFRDHREDTSHLLISITDGQHNTYSDTLVHGGGGYNESKLKELISRVQATGRWTLTFLLPPGEKNSFVRSFGIPEGNVAEWEGTAKAVSDHSDQLRSSIGSYYTGRSLGHTSSQSFFTTDLSQVSKFQVKALTDLSAQVRVFPVLKEVGIREFVEGKLKGASMLRGAAFYQLTKKEKKVQAYKQILIREKGGKKIYGGTEARELLGLPNTDVTVVPGNHANYDLFVESTSVNRKLVRGTDVIYFAAAGVPFKEGPSAVVPARRSKAHLHSWKWLP